MNINSEKIDVVIVKNHEGKEVARIKPGMWGKLTMMDGTNQLLIQQAKPKP